MYMHTHTYVLCSASKYSTQYTHYKLLTAFNCQTLGCVGELSLPGEDS